MEEPEATLQSYSNDKLQTLRAFDRNRLGRRESRRRKNQGTFW